MVDLRFEAIFGPAICLAAAQAIDRPPPRQGYHPSERLARARRIVRRFLPDLEENLLEHVSRDAPPMAHLAIAVLDAAEEGDGAARAIAERAGTALGAAAGLVARTLRMQSESFEVVLAGGVLRAGCRTLELALKKELRRSAPQAFPVRLEVPPVVGAALRALENVGETPGGTEHLRLSMETMQALHYGFV